MPGTDLFGGSLGYQDLRGTSIENTDPNIKPMYEDSLNVGWDHQLGARTELGVHYVHNNLGRTIEDMGSLVDGSNIYVIGNPGEGQNTVFPPSYPAVTAPFPTPAPKRQYDALEVSFDRRFSKNWFAGANYTLSRLYGNYAGLSNTDEVTTPTTGVSSGTSQQQGGSTVRPGSNASVAGRRRILWDSHGKPDQGGSRPTGPTSWLRGFTRSARHPDRALVNLPEVRRSTQVIVNDGYAPFRTAAAMGRTMLTRTDLLSRTRSKSAGRRPSASS